MTVNFRQMAHDALARAKAEMASDIDSRLPYAALELRKSMEALIYDRAQDYAEELPPSLHALWQPNKLLDLLIQLEPDLNQNLEFSISAVPYVEGVEPEWISLGSQKVLTLKTLKEHYSALGSFLHMPTLRQLNAGQGQDFAKLRKRSTLLVELISEVLASKLHKLKLNFHLKQQCTYCNVLIVQLMRFNGADVHGTCECGNEYGITQTGPTSFNWEFKTFQHRCTVCGVEGSYLRPAAKIGQKLKCGSCESIAVVRLGAVLVERKEIGDEKPAKPGESG